MSVIKWRRVKILELIDELADVFLNRNDEMSCVLNYRTGKVLLDAPESLTGMPEIDWDSEEAADLVEIPMATASEIFEVMVEFAEQQADTVTIQLLDVLNKKRPFRMFKDKVEQLGIKKHWNDYEQSYARRVMTEWLKDISEMEES